MFRPLSLIRRVTVLSGSPRMRTIIRPRFDWGRLAPEITRGSTHVRYVGPAGGAVIARFPETLVSDQGPRRAGRVQAWVVGPGAGDDAATVAEVLEAEVPVLIDADGLRLAEVAAVRGREAPTLMTPHAGEAAALLGVAREEVEGARLAAVRELAGRYGATVVAHDEPEAVGRAWRDEIGREHD